MVSRILLLLAALVALPSTAFAQDLEGRWALRIMDANIFIFGLEQAEDGTWSGDWTVPNRARANGVLFSDITGSVTRPAMTVTVDGDVATLVFANPGPTSVPERFRITRTGPNTARLEHLGTGLEPYPAVRVPRSAELGPFDPAMIYDRDNAVEEYDFEEEPAEEAPVEEVTEEALPEPEPEPEDIAAPEAAIVPESAMGADFLDDLSDEDARDTMAESEEPAVEAPAAIARACSDLDRNNPPTMAELDAMWGEDYEQMGSGLDIREYRMDNGDIARVTGLDERVYINRCGPA